MMKIAYLAVLLPALLAGCSTLSTNSKSAINCQALDWREIGVQDGRNGRYPYEITRLQKHCPSVNIDTNARAKWESGRLEGLKHYCTKAMAYNLGQRGYELNQVCPEEGLLEIQQSHALGFSQFYQRNRLNQMFDYRFHRHYIPQAWYDAYHPWY